MTTTSLCVRARPDQLARWRIAAAAHGVSLSAWLAATLDAAITGEPTDWEAIPARILANRRAGMAIARAKR